MTKPEVERAVADSELRWRMMAAPADQLALVQILDALRPLAPADRFRVLDAVLVFHEHPGLAIVWRTT